MSLKNQPLPPAAPDPEVAVYPHFVFNYDAGIMFLKQCGWTDEEIAAIDDEGDDE